MYQQAFQSFLSLLFCLLSLPPLPVSSHLRYDYYWWCRPWCSATVLEPVLLHLELIESDLKQLCTEPAWSLAILCPSIRCHLCSFIFF
uniref:Secreted protein n=1 Tax=Rhipicephalus appendiculatus TaxID=34631 RepID=A0A131YFJ8_RHIAP